MIRETILEKIEKLAEVEGMLADPIEARRKLEIKYNERHEELISILREINNEAVFKEFLGSCSDQRSYEFLARALGEVIGSSKVLEIETR